MRVLRLLGGVIAVAVMTACTASAAGDDADVGAGEDDIAVANRCDREYGSKIRAKVAIARQRLERLDTPYAREVKEALDSGAVEPLPMCKMTRLEFKELQKGMDLTAFGATPEEQYQGLRRAEAPGMRSVHGQIYGFQWENRIYMSTSMSDALVLETIAHEVRHVLRKAHERNFEDQRVTCVEEIAAFEAEILVKKDSLTEEESARVKRTVRELYELDKLHSDTCTYR
jgi:hypothetical protein